MTEPVADAPELIVALDRPTLGDALALVDAFGDGCRFYKVGLELYTAAGPAAVEAVRRPDPPRLDTAWLIGVARHKLVDHWRRAAREERRLRAVGESRPATTRGTRTWTRSPPARPWRCSGSTTGRR